MAAVSGGTRVTLAPAAPVGAGTSVVVEPTSSLDRWQVDDALVIATLEPRGADRARLTIEGEAAGLLILPPDRHGVIEVVVDGWRVEVTTEPDDRARLRERATRGHGASERRGPAEVRAIIPGRVVSVAVSPGDAVTAGQQLLVLEAMKMQNELRAPRDGTVTRIATATGQTIEIGDVLLVLE